MLGLLKTSPTLQQKRMALNILKLLYDLLRLIVAGIRSVDWTNVLVQCFDFFCCLVGYLGLSLAITLLAFGAVVRTTQSLFVIYLCLSPR